MSELIHLLHTPEELISYSNLAHKIEGFIIFVLVIILLLSIKYPNFKKYRSMFLFLTGIFLVLFVFLHHPPSEWKISAQVILEDRQQMQHALISIVAMAAGILDYIGLKKGNSLSIAFPALFVIIGIIFLMHPQHGTDEAVSLAIEFHEILGSLLVSSGFFILASNNYNNKVFFYLAVILLLIISIMLLTYQEPIGAYHQG